MKIKFCVLTISCMWGLFKACKAFPKLHIDIGCMDPDGCVVRFKSSFTNPQRKHFEYQLVKVSTLEMVLDGNVCKFTFLIECVAKINT